MGKIGGFKEYNRADESNVAVLERVSNYNEFTVPLTKDKIKEQGSRCMDCGIPFCHNGCPLGNIIPEFNDAVWEKNWQYAYEILASTNNFPEFTGRICPAPCEASCTLNISDQPVTIKSIECAIVDRGWNEGWIIPQKAAKPTGKRVAVERNGHIVPRSAHASTAVHNGDTLEIVIAVGGG